MKGKSFLIYTIYSDFYRAYGKNPSKKELIKLFLKISNQGPRYMLYLRIANYLYKKNSKILIRIFSILLNRMTFKYGVEISYKTNIGKGLSIPHFNSIVIGESAVIGDNCTILQGTTIGSNLFKSRYDLAIIGNNVLIGSGAKIIGPISIGNNVTIGANAVVTKNVPDNAVIVGAPAQVINYKPAVEIGTDYLSYKQFSESGDI